MTTVSIIILVDLGLPFARWIRGFDICARRMLHSALKRAAKGAGGKQ